MTVTADDRRRVALPHARPGDRFDVAWNDGKYVLVPLVPEKRKLSDRELLRRVRSIKWTTKLTPAEARACVKEGRP